jgi:hypothetical protein
MVAERSEQARHANRLNSRHTAVRPQRHHPIAPCPGRTPRSLNGSGGWPSRRPARDGKRPASSARGRQPDRPSALELIDDAKRWLAAVDDRAHADLAIRSSRASSLLVDVGAELNNYLDILDADPQWLEQLMWVGSSSSPASTLPTSQACWRGRRRPGSPVHNGRLRGDPRRARPASQRSRRPQQMPLWTSETTIIPGVGFRAELGDYLFQ